MKNKTEIMLPTELEAESRQFYKSLYAVVAPIALQNLLSSLVNSLDVVMLNLVSQTATAAVSLANQVQFILMLFYIGLASGLTMLTSQYWGKQDIKSLKILTGTALRVSAVAGFIFSGIVVFFPELIMRIFTDELPMIECGAEYLRVVGISYFFLAVSQVYQAVLKSIEKVGISTATTVIALVLNMFLNATFVLGWFGLPKMGVFGIALATVIARLVEMVICIAAGWNCEEVKIVPSDIFLNNQTLTRDFIHFSMPAVGNEFIWGAAFATYSVILGRQGEDIVAANSVVNVLRNLASIVCFGMAYGGAIILGKQLGENRLETARRNARRLIKSTVIAGIAGGIIMIVMYPLLSFFPNLTEQAKEFTFTLLVINSYSLIGAAVNTVLICGIFRAGGDARFGFVLDSIFMWGVSIPLGCLAAFVFKLPPQWVYFVLFLDEFEKMPGVISHYFKGKWLKNITKDVVE